MATHTSADGDAIASLLAGAEILKLLGSSPVCGLDGIVPARFLFLPGSDKIARPEALAPASLDRVLVVDAGNLSRIGEVSKFVASEATLVTVDHHPDNEHFGKLNIVYPDASSTAEILFDLAQALNLKLTGELATQLYTGLLTDTGGFRFSNTSRRTFSIAAQLAGMGAQPGRIAEAVFYSNPLSGMKMLGEALSSLELYDGGRVAIMTIRCSDSHEEMEELADYALAIRGVQAAALFRFQDKSCRTSLRGRGSVDVAQIARRFGGGGHQKAAGFSQRGRPGEIRSRVIKALCEEVEKSEAHRSDAA